MTSVIRIKRKRDCEPVGSWLLAKKRGKFEHEKIDETHRDGQFFRFAGTVEAKLAHSTHVVSEQIKRAIEAQKIYKVPFPNLLSASHTEKRRSSEPLMCEPRKLRVLNSQTFSQPIKDTKTKSKRRCTVLGSGIEKLLKQNENIDPKKASKSKREVAFQNSTFNSVFDVHHLNSNESKRNDVMCNNVKMVREKLTLNDVEKPRNLDDEEYVYDLYYCENAAKSWEMGDLLYIQPYQNDYVHCSSEEDNGEESDSNDEDNWRNDYPDEDSSDESSSSLEQQRFMMEEEDELDREDEGLSDCESYENDGFAMGEDGSKHPIDNQDDVDYFDDFADEIALDNDCNDDYMHNDDQYNDNENVDDDNDV